ncbi:hypothetical protein ACVGOW_01135 [Pseudonocardia saturnea]
MRRNPSPEVGRSETTAELIARISAERDAPLQSSGRHAIITAPPRTAAPPRPTAAPQIRRPRRPAADRALSPDTDPRMHAYRPVLDDEPSELRTGPIDLSALSRAGAAPVQRAGTRTDPAPAPDIPRPRRDRALAVVDDVLHDPAADETPTGVMQFVAPDAPAPRRTTRLALSAGLVAVAMVLVGSAAAGWFGGTGPSVPADAGAVIAPVGGIGVVPEPAPTGPTVPAPVNGAPADAAPAPAVPAPAGAPAGDEVQLTGGPVPPAESSYEY